MHVHTQILVQSYVISNELEGRYQSFAEVPGYIAPVGHSGKKSIMLQHPSACYRHQWYINVGIMDIKWTSMIQAPILQRVYELITEILCKFTFALMTILIIQSGHKFALVTTAELLWHVQNCGLIWWLFFLVKSIGILTRFWMMS